MTKSKRQLRAEAVERLNNWPVDAKAGPLLDTVLGKAYDPYDYEKDLVALIDLLTDDESPEGGEMSGTLRETPEFAENPQKSARNGKNDDFNDTREKLEADVRGKVVYSPMVDEDEGVVIASVGDIIGWLDRQAAITERDAFMRGRASLDDEFAELTAERDELASDLYAEHALVIQLQADVELLHAKVERLEAAKSNLIEKLGESNAERDEWKAKAESTAELLREVGRLRAKVDELRAELDQWEKMADGIELPDYPAAKFVPMDVYPESTTKNPIKRLKRCLRKGRSHAYSSGEEFYNAFEAAIEYAREQFEKLEADCTTAEGEEDRLRGEVADLEAERDMWRGKCGRMLDAIHDAERVME